MIEMLSEALNADVGWMCVTRRGPRSGNLPGVGQDLVYFGM